MAWLLVRLKLRLLGNALRSTTGAKVSFILSTIVAAAVAVGLFISLATLRHNGAAVDLTAVTFTTFAFGWLILPLLTFGLDATLDPATLAPSCGVAATCAAAPRSSLIITPEKPSRCRKMPVTIVDENAAGVPGSIRA